MSRPLPQGDPTRLGSFRLTARLDETAAGIVYLGVGEDGVPVSIAVLTRGAAEDAAARDRFRAAVVAALRRQEAQGRSPGGRGPGGSLERWAAGPDVAAGGRTDDGGEGQEEALEAPVVAAQPYGGSPWVATAYEQGRRGAERFLEPVAFSGSAGGGFLGRPRGARRGPHFQPHWAGSRDPAVSVAPPVLAPDAPPGGPEPVQRGLAAAVISLAAMLAMLALLMTLLFSCRPAVAPPPAPPPTDEPSSRTVTPPPPRTRTESPPPSPSPVPTGTGGSGSGEPA